MFLDSEAWQIYWNQNNKPALVLGRAKYFNFSLIMYLLFKREWEFTRRNDLIVAMQAVGGQNPQKTSKFKLKF